MRWYLLAVNDENAMADGPWGYDDEGMARERFTGYEHQRNGDGSGVAPLAAPTRKRSKWPGS